LSCFEFGGKILGRYWGVFILILANLQSVSAQETQSAFQESRASLLQNSPNNSQKKWLLDLILKFDTNLHAKSDEDADAFSSLVIQPTYTWSDHTKITGRVDVIQKYTGNEASKFSNSEIVFDPYSINLNPEWQFRPEVSIILPTDADSRHDQSYNGTLSLRPTFAWTPEHSDYGISNTVYFSRNLHDYSQGRDFSPNVEYMVRERIILYAVLTRSIKLQFWNDYAHGWTYQGFEHEGFYFSQFLFYDIAPHWLGIFSHQNESDVNGPNNHGETLAFFSKRTSYFSLGVGHEF
jgi:hypothetical protein